MNTLVEKISNIENNAVSKSELSNEMKPLANEISAIKKEMISKNDIKIKLRTITGKDIEIYTKRSDKIYDLKSKIREKENISEGQQSIFLDDKLLNDNSTLSDNNIKESSNLFLMKSDDEIFNFASAEEKIFIINSIKKILNKGINVLLYSARKDGDDASTFHKKVDKNKDLLYLIKTTNDISFAIYIDKPLLSDGNSRTDSLQMVISPAHKFAIKSLNNNATYHCRSDKGAQFHCMELNTPFLSSNCVDINSCNDFNLPAYPTGNSSYNIKELEVYSLKDYTN
jgi:hypothetical protein